MDKSRNYILDRLTSKKTTIEEFNFETLQAPPLSMFLSPYDINELNGIARSLKLSAKPQIRYQEIDRVMRRCGLVKFAAGTNRVVYRHPEFPDILFKVAADAVGLGDNPAEYRNQFILKPFVTKCFEISPCGTIGIFERVNPITSREEFLSVSDDVFELLNEWIIGKYIIADCGSKYFMNFGVRKGFGVVVLDYPYLYVLDGNKLYCKKPDPLSLSSKCDGIIDYDDGYNFLRCTKCGAIYKAKELEAKLENSELVLERKGETKMKITISGGTNNIKKNTITTGSNLENPNFKNPISNTKSATNQNIVKADVEDHSKNDTTDDTKDKVAEDVIVKNSITLAPNKTVNGVNTSVIPRSPITISEDYKKECLEAKKKREEEEAKKHMTPDQIIKDALDKILDNLNNAENKDELIKDIIMSITNANQNHTMFNILINALDKNIDVLGDDDYISSMFDADFAKVIGKTLSPVIEVKDYEYDSDSNTVNVVLRNSIGFGFEDDVDYEDRHLLCIDSKPYYIENIIIPENKEPEPDVEEENKKSDSKDVYSGLEFYDAKMINIQDIYPNQKSHNIIVPITSDGLYLSNDKAAIIGIDILDDNDVDEISIVSKAWLDSTNKILDDMGVEEIAGSEEATDVDDVDGIPVGMVSSTNSEDIDDNMKKFIESEILNNDNVVSYED